MMRAQRKGAACECQSGWQMKMVRLSIKYSITTYMTIQRCCAECAKGRPTLMKIIQEHFVRDARTCKRKMNATKFGMCQELCEYFISYPSAIRYAVYVFVVDFAVIVCIPPLLAYAPQHHQHLDSHRTDYNILNDSIRLVCATHIQQKHFFALPSVLSSVS